MKLDELIRSKNICDLLDADEITKIGLACKQGYDDDKTTRTQWETFYADALKLALQVKEDKTFPWKGASNVKFPLLTIAALNFHAKAYPVTISGDRVVKQRVIGKDPDGLKSKRAERVSSHMSYQVLEEMPWEEQQDKGILVLAILGTIFKKTIRSEGQNCSDLVMPQDLIVNYYTDDINTARVSHVFRLTKNELYSNAVEGIYREGQERSETPPVGPLEAAKDKAQKLTPPASVEENNFLVEQCCYLDLDEDGYEEPYFVTFHRETGFVYRILARYLKSGVTMKDKRVVRIKPELCWTVYRLIPSPDGGFYGMGLGLLLGPINNSVDTLINQLIDAGTMSNLGGGFLGRGVRMKAGDATFKPLEWKTVDSTGADLNKNIVPLPVREPSTVLFNLLTYLVGYGERVAGSGDIQVGELPGQNVKAETMRIADENGRLIFNAIFKRFWRSMKEEFKKLYRLNQLYQDTEQIDYSGKVFEITKDDYSDSDKGICPAADPNIVSRSQKKEQAQLIYTTSKELPGHDMYQVGLRLYEAFEVDGVDSFYPDPKSPQGQALQPGPSVEMMKLQIDKQLADATTAKVQAQAMDMQNRFRMEVAVQLKEVEKTQAEIEELKARAVMETAKAQGENIGKVIALIDAQIGAKRAHHDALMATITTLSKLLKDSNDSGFSGRSVLSSVDAGSADGANLQLPAPVQTGNAGGLGQPAV